MKVVIVVSGLPPEHLGGAELAALQLASRAIRMGHDVHLIAIGDGPEEVEGVPVHWVRAVGKSYIRGASCVPMLASAVRDVRPELIHAQSSYVALGAMAAHTVTGIPYLLYERGGVYLNNPLNRSFYWAAMKTANRVVAQTEDQKLALLRYCRRDIEVIPNGIDVDRFGKMDRITAREHLRRDVGLAIGPDEKVALAVGRCRPEKNMIDFVLASTVLPEVRFVLVGDGPQLEDLKRAENGRVTFVGAVDNRMIPTFMSAADILVNTSFVEGFPMSLLEGMACGLPIVASQVCGIPEIVSPENGELTRPRSYLATAMAIKSILGSPGLCLKMAEANKRKAKLYSWENVVRKLYGQGGGS